MKAQDMTSNAPLTQTENH